MKKDKVRDLSEQVERICIEVRAAVRGKFDASHNGDVCSQMRTLGFGMCPLCAPEIIAGRIVNEAISRPKVGAK